MYLTPPSPRYMKISLTFTHQTFSALYETQVFREGMFYSISELVCYIATVAMFLTVYVCACGVCVGGGLK